MTCASSLLHFGTNQSSQITHTISRSRRKLSSQSTETYCRAVRALFGFLKREGFVEDNVMAKVKMPKVLEKVIPSSTGGDSGRNRIDWNWSVPIPFGYYKL